MSIVVNSLQQISLSGSPGPPGPPGPAGPPGPVASVADFITVGKTPGQVDHTSIAAAITDAIGRGVSNAHLITVWVYPGTYVEPPMTIPPGLSVLTPEGSPSFTARVVAANPNANLFTMTGGFLGGMILSGVSNPANSLVRVSGVGVVASILSLLVTNASTGVRVEAGATCTVNRLACAVLGPGASVDTVLSVDGIGTNVTGNGVLVAVPAAVLPFYPGINPVRRGISVTSGASIKLVGISLDIAAGDPLTQASLFADTGAVVTVVGSIFAQAAQAVWIGAGGANTSVTVQGSRLMSNTTNFRIDSATGRVFAVVTVDTRSDVLVPGATVSGIQQVETTETTDLVGRSQLDYLTGRDASLPIFVHDAQSAGFTSGGQVTAGAGLTVNVTSGTGWVTRGAPDSDVQDVAWNAAVLAVPANAQAYIFFSTATLALDVSTSVPSDNNILLATVNTGGAAVRFVHGTRLFTLAPLVRVDAFVTDTIGIVLATGLAATAGSLATRFQVDIGAWYVSLALQNYPGSGGDATFSSFYGAGGATETAGLLNVDTTNYDNAGVLTAMTAGFFRNDTLYLTSDGRLSLIYGTAQFATQPAAAATNAQPAPPFVQPSGIRLAGLVIQQGVGIVQFTDLRPRLTTINGGTAGVTDHGLLSGLLDDDHPQYLLASGARPMAGNLDLGAFDVVNVGLVDGVDVSAHAVRHQPGGIDAIATAVPVGVVLDAVPAEGVAASLARSDHQHGLGADVPVDTGTANAEGVSASVARADHVHRTLVRVQDEGVAAGSRPTLNFIGTGVSAVDNPGSDRVDVTVTAAVVTGSVPTQIDVGDAGVVGVATDAARADHQHALPAPAAPVDVTKSAASAGVATTVARADHKHDVATAVPVATGTANAEGVSSSLARADHVHRTSIAVQDEGSAAGTRPTLNFIGSTVAATDNPGSDRVDVMVTAAAVTAATTPTQIDVGDAGVIGVSPDAARADHQHALPAPAAPADVTKSAASAGVSTTVARADHKHDVSTATAVSTGTTNTEGVSASLSRADHVHRTLVGVQSAGAAVGSRPTVNFVSGATVVDNAGSDRVDVTVIGNYRQSVFADLLIDTTTVSTVFVPLLSASITITTGGILLVRFSASASNSNNNNQVIFRLLIDGVAKHGAALVSASGATNVGGASLVYRQTGLAVGLHTVDIQWRVSGTTGRIRPVTNPDLESASLLVEEVSA